MSEPGQPVTDVSGADIAAPTVEQMAQELADSKIRSTLGDFEKKLAQMMADAEKGFADQQRQLDAQRAQLAGSIASVRAQAGPPEATLLAASLAQRVQSIANANPDIHPAHFLGVTDQASRLDEAVKAVADGNGAVADAERLAHSVITWFERSHPRASSKFLEGASTALDEAERILALLPELVPAVEAIAAAV
jgi:hypothetical protein